MLGTYDPAFLLTRLNLRVERDPDKNEFLNTSILYSSTTVHERMHWNQFAGTIWGNWCMFIYQSRYNLFFSPGNELIVKEIIKSHKEFKPNSDYSFDRDLYNKFPETQCLLYNDWLSHTITYGLFQNGGDRYSNVGEVREHVATSMAFTYFTVNNFLELGETGRILDYEKSLNFDDFGLIRPEGFNTISVKNLLEGQARASELLHFITMSSQFQTKQKEKEALFSAILNYSDTYWGSFFFYLDVCGLKAADIFRKEEKLTAEITKFCILVDIALNPPLVPFYPIEELKHTKWIEIFPPATFFKACVALAKKPKNLDVFNQEEILSFYHHICSALGRPTPFELAHSFMSTNQNKISQINREWEHTPFSYSGKEFYHYLFYVINKFCEVRQKYPIYISNYGLASIGEYSSRYTDILFDFNGKHEYVRSSPLQLDMNKSQSLLTPIVNNNPNERFFWLTIILLSNYIMNQLIMGNKISRDTFPFNIPDHVKKSLKSSVQMNFGISFDWE
ncbi:hypothetical protein [uncultured Croceitalea sp.]|uniref:hypothetical protein n=1 Tax=uncultured Croceitalea sp. TaxID=1798908 RepID=UPI00374EC4D1